MTATTTPKQSVMLGWLAPSMCHSAFVQSLVRMLTSQVGQRHVGRIVSIIGGPLIAQTRTEIVDAFLSSPYPWLLQLDSDMVFEPQNIERLIESADEETVPIVGALSIGTGQACAQPQAEAGWLPGDGIPIRYLEPEHATGVVPVDFVGAGALLVHRRVFEHLSQIHSRPQPWFQEVARDGRVDGEDWEFCRRATAAGFIVHVNTDVRLGHIKTTVLRPGGLR